MANWPTVKRSDVTLHPSPLEGCVDLSSLLARVRAEFLVRPGLCLTPNDATQLWGFDRYIWETLLRALAGASFLHRTEAGAFALGSTRT